MNCTGARVKQGPIVQGMIFCSSTAGLSCLTWTDLCDLLYRYRPACSVFSELWIWTDIAGMSWMQKIWSLRVFISWLYITGLTIARATVVLLSSVLMESIYVYVTDCDGCRRSDHCAVALVSYLLLDTPLYVRMSLVWPVWSSLGELHVCEHARLSWFQWADHCVLV
jgi:hypothetical protein